MVGKMLNLREGSGYEGKMKVNGFTYKHTHTHNPFSRHCLYAVHEQTLGQLDVGVFQSGVHSKLFQTR